MNVLNIIFLLLSLLFIGIIDYKYSIKKGKKLINSYRRCFHDNFQ